MTLINMKMSWMKSLWHSIVWPWEDLQLKWNRYGLGYEKDVNNHLHIPNYCKLVCFVCGGFLNYDRKTKVQNIGKEHVRDIVDYQDDDDDVGVDD